MKLHFNSTAKVNNPNEEKGIKVPYAGAKRTSHKLRWYFLILIALSPICIVAWIYLVPQLKVEAVGIITTEPLLIKAPSKGTIEFVDVNLGDSVMKDEILLTLYNPELTGQYQEVDRQILNLTQQQIPFSKTIMTQLEQRKRVAKEGVERQQELLNTYKDYKSRGIVPVSDLASAIAAFNSAQLSYEQTKVDILREKERQEMERLYGLKGQRYQDLSIEFAKLSALQQNLVVKTPFSGNINDIFVQDGQFVDQNSSLFSVDTGRELRVHAYLAPKFLEYSKIGQKATVKLPNGKKFDAVINEYTELTSKIPPQLSGPFEGEKAALKLILQVDIPAEYHIEGLPVEIQFDRITMKGMSDLFAKH